MNKLLISLLTLFLGTILGCSVGSFITYKMVASYYDTNPVIKTSIQNDEYLRSSACKLYDNFKSFYLNLDDTCNSNSSCKNSAKQKDAYEKYKSWDSFKNTYCNQ